MDPVVHFEMPYEDRERAAKFYTDVFDWQPQMLGSEMGNYMVMMTTETDKVTGRPKVPGSINGGFYKKPEDPMGHAPSFVIAVDDIKVSMKKVEAMGGKILGEPMDIPGVGRYVSFLDTEGNRVSLLQSLPPM